MAAMFYGVDVTDMNIRQINALFRKHDESHLWPICGRFNATERAIRHLRKIMRCNGETGGASMPTCSMKKSDLSSTERIEMEVCEEYKENRRKWMRRYAELERRYEEADRNEQWDRAERIGDALADMEQNSGFQKCLMCRKKGCPTHFDGFATWEPMDENLHQVRI